MFRLETGVMNPLLLALNIEATPEAAQGCAVNDADDLPRLINDYTAYFLNSSILCH